MSPLPCIVLKWRVTDYWLVLANASPSLLTMEMEKGIFSLPLSDIIVNLFSLPPPPPPSPFTLLLSLSFHSLSLPSSLSIPLCLLSPHPHINKTSHHHHDYHYYDFKMIFLWFKASITGKYFRVLWRGALSKNMWHLLRNSKKKGDFKERSSMLAFEKFH